MNATGTFVLIDWLHFIHKKTSSMLLSDKIDPIKSEDKSSHFVPPINDYILDETSGKITIDTLTME